MTIVNVVIVC